MRLLCVFSTVLLALILALNPGSLLATAPESPELILRDGDPLSYELRPYLALYTEEGVDPTQDPASVFNDDSLFAPHTADTIPNFGFSNDSHWVRVRIRSESARGEWFLSFNHPAVDRVHYFLRCPGEATVEYLAGDQVPQSEWPIRDRRPLFPLALEQGQSCQIFLNLTSSGSISVPLTLYAPEKLTRVLVQEALVFGSYYGIMVVIILINLVLWLRTLEKTYFWNFLFLFVYTLGVPMLNGLAFQYLWPELPALNNMLASFLLLGAFLLQQFARIFLNAKVLAPALDRAMLVVQIIIAPALIASLFIDYKYSIIAGSLAFAPGTVITVIAGVYIMLRGYRPARFYVLGWGLLLLGALVYALQNFGLVPINLLTNYGYQIGSVFEALFVSLGVSSRLRILRDQAQNAKIALLSSRRHQQSQILNSTRLELEMLKRTIQPHFLLNSLNAAQGWLEVAPEKGVHMLDKLAEELRLILSAVDQTTVPLEREIELCGLHLEVMGLRLNKDLRLEVRRFGEDASISVPPLVLHTLVENGVTHGYQGRKSGVFVIRARRRGERPVLTYFNDGSLQSGSATRGTGIGLR